MDQADRLRTLSGSVQNSGKTRIISVTSGKGGVGKSNISVNLATLYAKKGLKVALIDGDFGLANANLLLGTRIEKTIDDVLRSEAGLENIFLATRQGFDLLPSSSGVRKLVELDAFTQRTLFEQILQYVQKYDIVIYDTAPGLGSHVLNFNTAAHDIVVVSLAEPTALADSYALIKVLAVERQEKKFRLLINRCHEQTEGVDAFQKMSSVMGEFLNIGLDYLGSLPEDISVLRSVKRQNPVVSDSAKAPFSVALSRIADKLLASVPTKTQLHLWNNGSSSRLRLGA